MYAFSPTAGLGTFLSPRACSLLLDRFHYNLRSASFLARGTPTGLPVDALFGLLKRIGAEFEQDEADERRRRLIHYASQAWNMNFFLTSLVSSQSKLRESPL
jgi:hypothetical protein